jgi:hypothetical protein
VRFLPRAFDDADVCHDVAGSGLLSHVVALLETSPSQVEVQTGLRIIDRLLRCPKPTERCACMHACMWVSRVMSISGQSFSGCICKALPRPVQKALE